MEQYIDLKNGYKITNTIYHSMGGNYIPYIVGVVVTGPKGGKYVLDAFGIQHLFRYFKIQVKQGIDCVLTDSTGTHKLVSKQLVREPVLMDNKTNEECACNYAKAYGYKYIKRIDVLSFIDKIRR